MSWSFQVGGTPRETCDAFANQIAEQERLNAGAANVETLRRLHTVVDDVVMNQPPGDAHCEVATHGHVDDKTGATSRHGTINLTVSWYPAV